MKSFIIMVLICISAINSFAGEKIAIIANKDVKASSIDVATLKNIYALDATTLGGTKLKVFDYSSENGSLQTFYGALGKPQSEYKKLWLKAKLTGAGNPPTVLSSDSDMLSKVASTPGAIGYIPASKVTGDVKVLLQL